MLEHGYEVGIDSKDVGFGVGQVGSRRKGGRLGSRHAVKKT